MEGYFTSLPNTCMALICGSVNFFKRNKAFCSLYIVILEKAMAPLSSTLAWKTPWMEEPGRLQSVGSRRVGHNWATSFHFSLSCIGEGNGNPLQCSCLENARDAEPGGLPSMGSHRVRLDWSDLAAAGGECLSHVVTQHSEERSPAVLHLEKDACGSHAVLSLWGLGLLGRVFYKKLLLG